MRTLVVGSRATNPIQHLVLLARLRARHIQTLRPFEPIRFGQAVRIPLPLHRVHRLVGRRLRRAFTQGEVATQVDDRPKLVDRDRARVHTRHAGRAVPQLLGVDHVAVNRTGRLFVRGLEQFYDDVLRRERLARQGSRANVLAASAARARVKIEQLLPRKLFELADAERFLIFNVLDSRERAGRLELFEEGVDTRDRKVRHLGERDGADKEKRDRGVEHPNRSVERFERAHVEGREQPREWPSDERAGRAVHHALAQLDGLGGLCGEAERLDDESGQNDERQRPENPEVFVKVALAGPSVQPRRPLSIADNKRSPETEEGEDAKNIEDRLVNGIETILQQAPLVGIDERTGNIPVNRGEGGAHKQDDHAPHNADVHRAGGLAIERDLFRRDPHGKPHLDARAERPPLEFAFALAPLPDAQPQAVE